MHHHLKLVFMSDKRDPLTVFLVGAFLIRRAIIAGAPPVVIMNPTLLPLLPTSSPPPPAPE